MRQLRKLPINAEVELNLPDGRSVVVVHDETHRSESGNHTFVGHLRDLGKDYRVIDRAVRCQTRPAVEVGGQRGQRHRLCSRTHVARP